MVLSSVYFPFLKATTSQIVYFNTLSFIPQETSHSLYKMLTSTISLWATVAFTASAAITNSTSTTDCDKVRSDCQSQPDANQSYCAALYAQCAGTTSGLNKPYATNTTSAAIPSSTADCAKIRSDCQAKPDPNESYCAALYYQCAGTTSGLNEGPAVTSQDITIYTTVCPATTTYTSGTDVKTSVYITTSTITSCKGGCTAAPGATSATTPAVSQVQSAASTASSAVQFTGAGSALKAGSAGIVGVAAMAFMI